MIKITNYNDQNISITYWMSRRHFICFEFRLLNLFEICILVLGIFMISIRMAGFLSARRPVSHWTGHIEPPLAKFSHSPYHLFLNITSAEKGSPYMVLYVPGTS